MYRGRGWVARCRGSDCTAAVAEPRRAQGEQRRSAFTPYSTDWFTTVPGATPGSGGHTTRRLASLRPRPPSETRVSSGSSRRRRPVTPQRWLECGPSVRRDRRATSARRLGAVTADDDDRHVRATQGAMPGRDRITNPIVDRQRWWACVDAEAWKDPGSIPSVPRGWLDSFVAGNGRSHDRRSRWTLPRRDH